MPEIDLAILIILVSGIAPGQAALGTPARQAVFTAVHESLSDAADRVLAASLADKDRMNASDSDAVGRANLCSLRCSQPVSSAISSAKDRR